MSLTSRVLGRDQPPTIGASTADAVNVLKNQRRRHVIDILADADGPMTVSDLAEQLAARENDKPRRQLSSDERKRAYVGLYQHHLDILEDAGAIAPRSRRQPVRPGPDLAGYDELREIVESRTGGDA